MSRRQRGRCCWQRRETRPSADCVVPKDRGIRRRGSCKARRQRSEDKSSWCLGRETATRGMTRETKGESSERAPVISSTPRRDVLLCCFNNHVPSAGNSKQTPSTVTPVVQTPLLSSASVIFLKTKETPQENQRAAAPRLTNCKTNFGQSTQCTLPCFSCKEGQSSLESCSSEECPTSLCLCLVLDKRRRPQRHSQTQLAESFVCFRGLPAEFLSELEESSSATLEATEIFFRHSLKTLASHEEPRAAAALPAGEIAEDEAPLNVNETGNPSAVLGFSQNRSELRRRLSVFEAADLLAAASPPRAFFLLSSRNCFACAERDSESRSDSNSSSPKKSSPVKRGGTKDASPGAGVSTRRRTRRTMKTRLDEEFRCVCEACSSPLPPEAVSRVAFVVRGVESESHCAVIDALLPAEYANQSHETKTLPVRRYPGFDQSLGC